MMPRLLHERLLLDVLRQYLRKRMLAAMFIDIDGPLVRPEDLPVHELVVNDDHTWTHTWRWKPFIGPQETR